MLCLDLSWLRLWAVVAFDHQEFGGRIGLSHRDCPAVFGRPIAIERRLIARKLDHDMAAAIASLHRLERTGARQVASLVLAENIAEHRRIALVAFGIADIDMRDPVPFGHGASLLQSCLAAFAISATIAAAAACGSGAATIGRPMTR